MREILLRLFVEIGHGNTSGEDSVVGMFCRQISSCLGGEILRNTIIQNVKYNQRSKRTSSSVVVTP
jgi:hypothetical protein